MALVVETVAVVIAFVAASAVLPGGRPRVAIAVVPGIVCTVLAGQLAWNGLGSEITAARTGAATSPAQAEAANAHALGVRQDFIAWLRATLPRRATLWFVPPAGQPVAPGTPVLQWTTFELLPRRAVDRPADADYAVWQGGAPTQPPAGFAPLTVFAPGYAIARRLGAR